MLGFLPRDGRPSRVLIPQVEEGGCEGGLLSAVRAQQERWVSDLWTAISQSTICVTTMSECDQGGGGVGGGCNKTTHSTY